VVGPDDVSTGHWVVDQETGRHGSGGPCAPGHLIKLECAKLAVIYVKIFRC